MKAFVFPGQGTQRAGMIKLLGTNQKEVKDVFEAASDCSGMDVLDLCSKQNDETLSLTHNTQIAVTTMNLAFLRLLENRGIEPDIVLGQSLGQFAALAACGALSYEDVFRLVVKRSQLMAQVPDGARLCFELGLTQDVVEKVIAQVPPELGKLEIALINADTQIVFGGPDAALEYASEKLREMNVFRVEVARLNRAFHTSYMGSMEEEFNRFVDTLPIAEPKHRIILNCSAQYGNTAAAIAQDIKLQSCHTVLWRDSIKRMLENENVRIAEVGAGKTMSGIIRNIDSKVKTYMMSEMRDFAQYVKLCR